MEFEVKFGIVINMIESTGWLPGNFAESDEQCSSNDLQTRWRMKIFTAGVSSASGDQLGFGISCSALNQEVHQNGVYMSCTVEVQSSENLKYCKSRKSFTECTIFRIGEYFESTKFLEISEICTSKLTFQVHLRWWSLPVSLRRSAQMVEAADCDEVTTCLLVHWKIEGYRRWLTSKQHWTRMCGRRGVIWTIIILPGKQTDEEGSCSGAESGCIRAGLELHHLPKQLSSRQLSAVLLKVSVAGLQQHVKLDSMQESKTHFWDSKVRSDFEYMNSLEYIFCIQYQTPDLTNTT